MGSMDAARAAGFLILGLSLAAAGFLGAPLHLLLLIGAVPVATLFLPGGVGAAAAANLAQKLNDREAWEADWDKRYLPQGEGDRRTPARSGRREDGDVEPAQFRALGGHAIRYVDDDQLRVDLRNYTFVSKQKAG
jgi:hypothetical protein